MQTFVIRIYPQDDSGRPGRIEHVKSGSVSVFHSLDDVPGLIEDAIAGDALGERQDAGDDV